MSFATDLDRYLTTEPFDSKWELFAETVAERLDNQFYDHNEAWIDEYDGQYNKWLMRLYDTDKDAEAAAKIIERAYKLFKIKSVCPHTHTEPGWNIHQPSRCIDCGEDL